MNRTYCYHYDGNGNVVRLTDTNGAVVSTVDYTPFGSVLALSGPYTPRYQFSTKEYDGVVGVNYYGYRFYSPGLGRWVNRDPLGELISARRVDTFFYGQYHLYHFVRNAALDEYDVLGLFAGGGIECRGGKFVPIVSDGIRDPEVKKCALTHEQQHADDYNRWYPTYCESPGMDGHGLPGEGYDRLNWKRRLVQSECNAHTVSSDCLNKADECKSEYPEDIKANRKLHEELKDCYCAEARKWFPDPAACDHLK